MINAGPTTPTPDEFARLDDQKLRARLRQLVHERDNAIEAKAQETARADKLGAILRHVLTVACDTCKSDRITLALGSAADEGKHASGLYAAGVALGWRFGQATLGVLFQMMGRMQPVAMMNVDECPRCATKRGA